MQALERLSNRSVRKLTLTFLCGASLVISGCAMTADHLPAQLSSGELRFSTNPKTWKEILERHVVMQRYDYSCGAAAMATLLNYYFQDEVSEREILLDITERLTDAELEARQNEGLPLLDLKQFAERRGYQALGVELDLTALPKLLGPVLVYLHSDDYRHFAILRGVKNGRVFLADPSRGNVRMAVADFADEWPGIALVLGKEGFGTPLKHGLAVDDAEAARIELRTARRSLYLH
jgi:predicted double-glycine peptidase